MKANELRIGNWVQQNQEQYRCVSDTIVLFDNGEIELKPIPLTEEWLLRLGLRKLTYSWELGSMRIYDLSEENRQMFRITLADRVLVHLKYVHQLQNFVFAIGGQELKIKEV